MFSKSHIGICIMLQVSVKFEFNKNTASKFHRLKTGMIFSLSYLSNIQFRYELLLMCKKRIN